MLGQVVIEYLYVVFIVRSRIFATCNDERTPVKWWVVDNEEVSSSCIPHPFKQIGIVVKSIEQYSVTIFQPSITNIINADPRCEEGI